MKIVATINIMLDTIIEAIDILLKKSNFRINKRTNKNIKVLKYPLVNVVSNSKCCQKPANKEIIAIRKNNHIMAKT
jgi:hypothetical protein